MSTEPTCPQCHTTVRPDWDWCQACGFDPDGHKPAGWVPRPAATGEAAATAAAPAPRPATAPRWDAPTVPPAGPAQHPRPAGKVIGIVVISIVAVLALGYGALRVFGPDAANSLLSSASGAGATHPQSVAPPAYPFSATFAGVVTDSHQASSDGTPVREVVWFGTAKGNKQEIVVFEAVGDLSTPEQQQALLTRNADGIVAGRGTSVAGTFLGHQAQTFTFSVNGHDNRGVVLLVGTKGYVLDSEGPWAGTEANAQAFFNSFQPAA